MTALDAALALEQGDDVSMGVGQHLDLDVAGGGDVALKEDGAVAECREGLASCPGQGVGQGVRPLDDAHAPSAASGRGLDQQRPPEERHRVGVRGRVPVDRDRRKGRHSGRPHHVLGPDLGAHGIDGIRRRADPDQTGGDHGPGELARLRQEPVAGVDGVGPGSLRRLEQ